MNDNATLTLIPTETAKNLTVELRLARSDSNSPLSTKPNSWQSCLNEGKPTPNKAKSRNFTSSSETSPTTLKQEVQSLNKDSPLSDTDTENSNEPADALNDNKLQEKISVVRSKDIQISEFKLAEERSKTEASGPKKQQESYSGTYARAEEYLEALDLRICNPKDDTRTKNYLNVLNRNLSLNPEEASSPVYCGSPLLTKVAASSIIARRQNSPLLKGKGPNLSLQKYVSTPLKSSKFCPGQEQTVEMDSKPMLQIPAFGFKAKCQEVKVPEKLDLCMDISKSRYTARILKSKAIEGIIVEETSSPFTPKNGSDNLSPTLQ